MFLGNTAMCYIMQSTKFLTTFFAFYEAYLWAADK